MRRLYIHQFPDWPHFRYHLDQITQPLASLRFHQGHLLGRMESLGFTLQSEALLETLTADVLKSSEIEGENLNHGQVRSSIASRLGIDIGALTPADRNTEGIVEMTLDAILHYGRPLTPERLFSWHAALFPTGRSGITRIPTGAWRDDASGPMEVISGPMGREKVHFRAPEASRIPTEMAAFLQWFNAPLATDPVVKAALSHLWFVTIHPFADGNGRIARAIADMALARADGTPRRFYSMSSQIRAERNAYYQILEQTQSGSLDVTPWITWFLACLDRSMQAAAVLLDSVLRKARFWERFTNANLNSRQRLILNLLLDGFDGNLTTSKYAKLAKCSQDTALRDILALVALGALTRNSAAGRSTSYSLQSP